jgi:hypothetical protein
LGRLFLLARLLWEGLRYINPLFGHYLLRLEHGNIPIQLDLWGDEAIFRGKRQTTLYGYPRCKT